MATIYHYFNQQGKAEDSWCFSTRDSVQVTEVWELSQKVSIQCRPYFCKTFDIPQPDIKSWLHAPVNDSSSDAATGRTCRLRVIWIPRLVQKRVIDANQDLFRFTHRSWGLDIAQAFCETSSSGIGSIVGQDQTRHTHYFNYHPKISMSWTSNPEASYSTAICVAEGSKIKLLQDMLNEEFAQRILGHRMALALLCTALFSLETQETQEAIKGQVRQVEVRTGHHAWKSRAEPPALGDLFALAAKMSGCESRLGSCLRKQRMLAEMITFIERNCQVSGPKVQPLVGSEAVLATILDALEPLKQRTTSQQIDSDFIQSRVKIQTDAIYHLVQGNDVWAAQEMAQDCKLLAVASQQDSSGMKCIAIVTMFFLPGTFVSSLMAIPLFDWDATSTHIMYRSSYWRPRAIMFLAITLPLMLLTFASWGVWHLIHTGWKKNKSAVAAQKQLDQTPSTDEVRVLVSKRHTFSALTS